MSRCACGVVSWRHEGDRPEEVLCRQCMADLRLGRLARAMPVGESLEHSSSAGKGWTYVAESGASVYTGDTPEIAIESGRRSTDEKA